MLTLRQRIFIIVSIVVALLLAAVLYFAFVRKSAGRDTSSTSVEKIGANKADGSAAGPSNGASAVVVTPVNVPVSPTISLTPPEDLYLRQLATIFVERFWSYSNQNNDKHISDTLALATQEMQTWMKTRAGDTGKPYEGVTTQVLKAVLTKKNDVEATVEIGVMQSTSQKSATSTTAVTNSLNRSGRVELKQVAGEWKVSGLYWDKN